MYKNLTVLGPQRPVPNLSEVLEHAGVRGPVVMITAGWRHDEAETTPLAAAIGQPSRLLPIYRWFDVVMHDDLDLSRAYGERQDRIRALKSLYRVRVRSALEVVQKLLEHKDNAPDLADREIVRALDMVKEIDDQMLASMRDIRVSFPRMARSIEHPHVLALHKEAALMTKDADTVVVAGGHVAVLLNRIRFFGIDTLLQEALEDGKRVIVWSAGAMVMTPRIALYYDDPPDGPSDAEVLDNGLGLLPGLVLYPHARRRLRLTEGPRIARLARRFAPSDNIGLENGAWLERHPHGWINRGPADAAFRLGHDGAVRPLPVVATESSSTPKDLWP